MDGDSWEVDRDSGKVKRVKVRHVQFHFGSGVVYRDIGIIDMTIEKISEVKKIQERNRATRG